MTESHQKAGTATKATMADRVPCSPRHYRGQVCSLDKKATAVARDGVDGERRDFCPRRRSAWAIYGSLRARIAVRMAVVVARFKKRSNAITSNSVGWRGTSVSATTRTPTMTILRSFYTQKATGNEAMKTSSSRSRNAGVASNDAVSPRLVVAPSATQQTAYDCRVPPRHPRLVYPRTQCRTAWTVPAFLPHP